MKTTLNIPKLIHVGSQKRSGTYTGKLAYVIYTDEKGKKRKQVSWENWRDKKIPVEDYDNVPTSGFVLNKGVGGARHSWGHNTRNEYIRVFDPRGFEFEISVANLLFILQECDAYKGKGLDGEFVYAWDGTELVLLPVGCEEYNASVNFTALKLEKVTKKDIKEGHTYLTKKADKWVYLGRYACRLHFDRKSLVNKPETKYHVFYDTTRKNYQFERGFTKLAKVVDTDIHPEYADQVTKLLGSMYCDEIVGSKLVEIKSNTHHYSYWHNFLLLGNEDDENLQVVVAGHSYCNPHISTSSRAIIPRKVLDNLHTNITEDMDLIGEQTATRRRSMALPHDVIFNGAHKVYSFQWVFKSGQTIGDPFYVYKEE